MSNETEDQKWLEALGGKIAGKHSTSHLEVEATAIRNSLIRQSQSRPAYESSEGHFQKILAEANKRGLMSIERTARQSAIWPLPKRWSSLIGAIVSAFVFGAIAMRFAMMPGMEAIKSEGSFDVAESQKKWALKVSVTVLDPAEIMRAAVVEAARAELNFSVKTVEDGYDFFLERLIANSAEQAAVKRILGISSSANGNLILQIREKGKK